MDRALTSFIWVWVSLIILVNVFGIAGILASADTSWQALQKIAILAQTPDHLRTPSESGC